MPAITYIEFDGTEYHVDVAVGNSVMEGALNNMIDGIVAECGGCCVCCTCHCMIESGQRLLVKRMMKKMNCWKCSMCVSQRVD